MISTVKVVEQSNMPQKAKNLHSNVVYTEKWLRLKVINYMDEDGKKRLWESAERTTGDSAVNGIKLFRF